MLSHAAIVLRDFSLGFRIFLNNTSFEITGLGLEACELKYMFTDT